MPVAPLDALVYLKLASPRSQDRQDVFNLARAGADLELVRRYLSAHAPNLVQKLEAVVRSAAEEDGRAGVRR